MRVFSGRSRIGAARPGRSLRQSEESNGIGLDGVHIRWRSRSRPEGRGRRDSTLKNRMEGSETTLMTSRSHRRARRPGGCRGEGSSLLGSRLFSLTVLGLLVWGAGGGCAHAPEPPEARSLPVSRPLVERAPDGRLLLSWPRDLTSQAIRIYRGETPETIDRSIALAVAEPGTTELLLPAKRRGDYFFYELDTSDDSTDSTDSSDPIVGERRLPLEGPDNFRDLGGYETRDGRHVRWHRIYRSDDLAELTRRDLGLLRSLDIRGVCDLRSGPERFRDPNRSVDGASVHEMGIPVVGVDPVDLRHRIRTGGLDAKDVEATMIAAYRSFVTDHADRWARMLELLSDPANLPTVVHCTAGKDRTGFASALVLLLLGVPEETVFEDYLATNRYQADNRLWLERLVPVYSLFRTGAADMAPLLDARPAYLEASLEEIERGWGSVERYAEQRLGFSAAEQARLRSLLVE